MRRFLTSGKFLQALGWVLITVAVLAVAAIPFVEASRQEPLRSALPAAVLVALAGHLLSQGRAMRDAAEKRSLFYLESTTKAYEEARTLLSDGNNDRAAWIAAGRALAHAQELKKNVTEDPHCRVLELNELKYRGFFHDLLRDKPASFFYGVDGSMSLQEAAACSSAREQGVGRPVISSDRGLSEKSLRAVWAAAKWPRDYVDPLQANFSSTDKAALGVLFPGLNDYLDHREQWHSVGGKLISKDKSGAS